MLPFEAVCDAIDGDRRRARAQGSLARMIIVLILALIARGDGDRASRHPQCEALEFVLDGFALDSCGHERSKERLS